MEERQNVLQRAIELEVFGNYYYNQLKNSVGSEEGKGLLTYLANAEQEHRETLENMMVQAGLEPQPVEVDSVVLKVTKSEGIEQIFNQLMGKSMLEKIDAIEAVKLGINVEQKSIDFYSEHAAKSEDAELRNLFNELTGIEKTHLEALEANLRNLEDEGVWYGYVPILEG